MANANSALAKTRIAKRWAQEEDKLLNAIDGKTEPMNTKPVKQAVTRMVRVSKDIVRCRRIAVNY